MQRVLVLGASGFIGGAVCARLATQEYVVIGLSRVRPSPGLGDYLHLSFDIASAVSSEDWLPLLDGVTAVVNCAGTLGAGSGRAMQGVHATGIAALYQACEIAGVKRVIHFSAIGADRPVSAFSQSKAEGDQALMERDLDWVILRPSVVFGHGAYGGSALMRGLAASPIMPILPETEALQPVLLDDVVDTVVTCLASSAPRKSIIELVGPRRLHFVETVGLFRRWLRWKPAAQLPVPHWITILVYRAGDLAALLGWRSPIATISRREMQRGATGDNGAWRRILGREPRDLESALRSEPASVQERWFARLYALKPLVFAVFGAFWVATGIVSLWPGWQNGLELMYRGGVAEPAASWIVVAGALADIVIGCAILYRPTSRYGLLAALGISFIYAAIGTYLLPDLWREPLGPMLKIWPIIVLNLVALAIREDR
jgi:uncharacterized protein YbjT (DUF2867 family)